MTDDKTRKDFEEWAPGECELYRHAGTGNYASQTTQRLYRAWQAAKERYGQRDGLHRELYDEVESLIEALDTTPELNLKSWGVCTDSCLHALAKARGKS